MGLWEFVAANWVLITANPAPFISVFVLAFGAAWVAATFFYKHRIDALKERVEAWKEKAGQSPTASTKVAVDDKHSYPAAGFYGVNILASNVPEVVIGNTYSMTAHVPTGSNLRVHLIGQPHAYLEDVAGAWRFNVVVRNWIASRYDSDSHSQWFDAGVGDADLQFYADRAGIINITVYEGGRQPAWTKEIRVVDASPKPTPESKPPKVFRPDERQGKIIEALREADGHWTSLAELANAVESTSWQDLSEAVIALREEMWVESHVDNALFVEGARSFRLRGPGLAYARNQGYRTASEIRSEKFKDSE